MDFKGFSKLTTKKMYSEIFYLGGIGWRLLLFPKGNGGDCLSIYLEAADSETTPQEGWSIDAKFTLTVVNQIDDKLKVAKDFKHLFNAKESDWGLKNYMPLADLYDPNKGYLMEEDTCIIEVTVTVKSVVPPKRITNTLSGTQSLKQKKNSLDLFEEPPIKNEGSSAERVLHIGPTESAKVSQSEEPPSKTEGSIAPRVLHVDPTDSSKITQAEEAAKKIDLSSSDEKTPTDGHDVIKEHPQSEPLPSLFSRFGSMKVRNPPYSLPNGCRITEGAVLDEGDMAAQLIQSALLSSELQPLMEMPVDNLASQGYYHLAKFLHYQCASVISAQGLQLNHQENANVLEEIKRRDLEIQNLQLSLGKSAQEASQLRGDLEKVIEEKVKIVEEFSAAKEKIINLEEELQVLHLENVDLQIQLEDARQAEHKRECNLMPNV